MEEQKQNDEVLQEEKLHFLVSLKIRVWAIFFIADIPAPNRWIEFIGTVLDLIHTAEKACLTIYGWINIWMDLRLHLHTYNTYSGYEFHYLDRQCNSTSITFLPKYICNSVTMNSFQETRLPAVNVLCNNLAHLCLKMIPHLTHSHETQWKQHLLIQRDENPLMPVIYFCVELSQK